MSDTRRFGTTGESAYGSESKHQKAGKASLFFDRFGRYASVVRVELRGWCSLSSRSWFISLTSSVNLSWFCSAAILAANSRKRSRSFSAFLSTGPFPGQLPNGQCSDFLDVFAHRGLELGHYICKFSIVRRNRFGAKFADTLFKATVGHTTDSPTVYKCLLYSISCRPLESSCGTKVPHPTVRTVFQSLQSVGYPTIPEAIVKKKLNDPKLERMTERRSRATHFRRLDDRIRELSARIVASTEQDGVDHIVSELKIALHESIERLRIRAAAVLSGHRDFQDRRKAS